MKRMHDVYKQPEQGAAEPDDGSVGVAMSAARPLATPARCSWPPAVAARSHSDIGGIITYTLTEPGASLRAAGWHIARVRGWCWDCPSHPRSTTLGSALVICMPATVINVKRKVPGVQRSTE